MTDSPAAEQVEDSYGFRSIGRRSYAMYFTAILLVTLLTRLYAIATPPTDYHSWRQTQTLMAARNFAHGSMNLFRPEVDWRTTDDHDRGGIIGGSELQVVPWLTAIGYLILGESPLVDRIVPILFSILGIAFFIRFVGRYWSRRVGLYAGAMLSISPMFLFFGRVQMPEPFAFAMVFGALDTFDQWTRTRKLSHAVVATFFLVAMLLAKPQFAYMGIPFCYLVAAHDGRRVWREWRLLVMIGVIAPVFGAFLYYSNSVLFAESGLSFSQPALFDYDLLGHRDYYERILRRIVVDVLGVPTIVIAFIGFLRWAPLKSYGLLVAWLAAIGCFFLLIPGGNSANSYYQMCIAPPVCIAAALALDWSAWLPKGRHVAAIMLTIVLADSVRIASHYYSFDDAPSELRCGVWIDSNFPEDAKIFVADGKPATLYFASRTGWTTWFEGRGIPILADIATIDRLRKTRDAYAIVFPRAGIVKRFATAKEGPDAALWSWLTTKYTSYRSEDFSVFFLQDSPDSLSGDGDVVLPSGP